MNEQRPLEPTSIPEVPLLRAPLARVIAQVRFPSILAIRNPDQVAVFQEMLRDTYPNLRQDKVHNIELTGGETPNLHQNVIWRLADRETDARWQISLAVDFVALETSSYDSRGEFLDRLHAVIFAVEQAFTPASVRRFGLRYIDRLTDEGLERVADLIRSEVRGIIRPPGNAASSLGESVVHLITEVQFLVHSGARIQGRWGQLPANATYDPNSLEPIDKPSWVLDFDMYTTDSQPFSSNELLTTATGFAESLYWLFRQVVTDDFLAFYGGEI